MADPTPAPTPPQPTARPTPASAPAPGPTQATDRAPTPPAAPMTAAPVTWDRVIDHIRSNAQTRGPGLDIHAMGGEVVTATMPILLRYLGQFFHFVPKS